MSLKRFNVGYKDIKKNIESVKASFHDELSAQGQCLKHELTGKDCHYCDYYRCCHCDDCVRANSFSEENKPTCDYESWSMLAIIEAESEDDALKILYQNYPNCELRFIMELQKGQTNRFGM